MNLQGEEKPLEDAELEMVVQVIRRGLKTGYLIEALEERLSQMIATVQECKKRLKEQNRIGQEIARHYQRAIDVTRKHDLTQAEKIERVKWIQERLSELAAQLE